MSGSVILEVEVTDANDNSPVFDEASYKVTVSEDVEPYSSLLRVSILMVLT